MNHKRNRKRKKMKHLIEACWGWKRNFKLNFRLQQEFKKIRKNGEFNIHE